MKEKTIKAILAEHIPEDKLPFVIEAIRARIYTVLYERKQDIDKTDSEYLVVENRTLRRGIEDACTFLITFELEEDEAFYHGS